MPVATIPARDDVLTKAVERRASALVQATLDGKRYEFAVGLHDFSWEPGRISGIWAQLDGVGKYLADRLIEKQVAVEVSFKTADAAVMFESAVLKKKRHFLLNMSVLLQWPAEVRVVDFRGCARAPVPDKMEVTAKVALAKEISEALVGRVADISRSGAGIVLPAERAAELVAREKPVRLELDFNGESISVEAEVRNARPLSSGAVRLGLQFTTEGGSALANDQTYLKRLSDFEERRIQKDLMEQLKMR